MGKVKLLLILALSIVCLGVSSTSAFAAYSAHQNDTDISNFLAVYPFATSTKLDDCSLCHPGSPNGKSGSCDYCHQTYGLTDPHAQLVPLNSYGSAYKVGHSPDVPGRTIASIQYIQNLDSDVDGYVNSVEIQALTFPGDVKDHPGLVPAPAVGMNLERLLKLPDYSEFLLLNTSKETDFYARYRGVKIMDLLKYAGVSKNALGITVFSPDGYSKSFPIDVADPQDPKYGIQYDVMGPYPYGTYYGGLDFVDYGVIPRCIEDGDRIPDKLYMLLAYMRDGDPLTPGKINPKTLKLDGEGPYRLIPPQKIAGRPDRASTAKPVGDGWDYDSNKDHNAGPSVRTVAAIRVDPRPDGTTDFNWNEGGWNLVDHAKLVIYGAINPRTYSVVGKVSDTSGEGVPDVKLTFSLLSLGNVGEATTSSGGGHFKKWDRDRSGKFQIDLPAGEYTVVALKKGCTFTPASLSISLPDPECDLDGNHWDSWDHRERWEHCNRHPENEINFTGSCTP